MENNSKFTRLRKGYRSLLFYKEDWFDPLVNVCQASDIVRDDAATVGKFTDEIQTAAYRC